MVNTVYDEKGISYIAADKSGIKENIFLGPVVQI